MEIKVFLQVVNFLKQESERKLLLKKYEELEGLVKAAANRPESNFADEIFGSKERLKSYLHHNNPSKLGVEAHRLFKKFDKYDIFGEPGIDFIDKVFNAEPKNYSEIFNEINIKTKVLTKQLNAIAQFYDAFEQLIITDLSGNIDDEILKSGLYLFFEGEVTVKNESDLERYTRIWNGILYSFTGLTGFADQTPEFTNLQEKSNVLGVSLEEITLEAFMRGSLGILSSLYIIDKIKKIQTDVSPLILSNDYNQLLEEEIEGVIDNTASAVVEELINNYYKADPDEELRISENLNRSLKQILNFAQKGGRFECMPIADSIEGDALNKGLADSFRNIRRINSMPEKPKEGETVKETEITRSS